MKGIIALTLLAAGVAMAWTPSWLPSYELTCAGVIIDVGYYGAPCVVDWDGDGLKDLVLGQFASGNIRFYKNEGTNANPVFNTFSMIYADGSPITLPYG
ncbi:MAG: hypothetical protein R6V62_09205 [Candidatus Fermentibacteraceae bacterium]